MTSILHTGKGQLSGPWPPAAAQAMTTAGEVSVSTLYTTVNTTTGSGHASTLGAGSIKGQLKIIHLIVDGGDLVLTVSRMVGGDTITFADAGDVAIVQWDGNNWVPVMLANLADGATAPAVSTA